MTGGKLLGMESDLRENVLPYGSGDGSGLPAHAMNAIESLNSYQCGDVALHPPADRFTGPDALQRGQDRARVCGHETRCCARAEIAEQSRRGPAPKGAQFLIGPLPAPSPEAVAHKRVQCIAGERGIGLALTGPFDWNLEQLAAGIVARLAEIADLALHEIKCERLQFPDLTDIVVVEARLLEIADGVPPRMIRGGEHPFGEMAELLAQATALPVDVASRYEALIQHLAPGMLLHAELDIGLVHGGLCHG
ncbi:hypothetical protein ACVWWG_002602 [Bradyrhizobium sp. LB7.2]